MPEDSLKKRYFYKLSTNLVGLIINMVTQAIIPRGLGPKAYGDFNFLSSFFAEVTAFLDMGTSIGFYTKLSQRQRDTGLATFYMYFTIIASLMVISFVFLAHTTASYKQFWPGQKMLYVYMAAVLGILAWIVQVLNKMADAYGITVSAELTRMLQRGLGLILLILLFIFSHLNLTNFFYYHYLLLIFLGVAFIWSMKRKGHLEIQSYRLPFIQVRNYFKEFYTYSHPLFVYALIGLIVGILDRWLLQYFSGSIQQGFFGLSYQIGAACFLFTSAMTPLLMREFSIAYGKQDLSEMARLFRRYIPLLYSIAAYFSCFIAVQSDKVVYIFGGDKFKESAAVLTIMAFYPIHQTYGQLSGSVFYAAGQTALYRNIGVIFMLIGLPVTFFLIAPADKMGLNMGATGLAIKMVILQFIGVNVMLSFNAKFLNLSFWKYAAHQLISIFCLLSVSFLATFIVDTFLNIDRNIITSFALSGILYTAMIFLLVYIFPILFGLKREDFSLIKQMLK